MRLDIDFSVMYPLDAASFTFALNGLNQLRWLSLVGSLYEITKTFISKLLHVHH